MLLRSPLVYSLLLLLLASPASAGKDRNRPHGHRGILQAYEPGPFDVQLSPQDESLLAQGKPVMKQTLPGDNDEAGGGAICVQDVQAPKEAVWNQILDLDSYKGKVPKVQTSQNYLVQKNDDGSHTIKTRMVVGVMPGYSVRLLGVSTHSIIVHSIIMDSHPPTHPVRILLQPQVPRRRQLHDLEPRLRQDLRL